MTELEPQQPAGISRRTVTKAMAWAVPVIAVAAPVPAFAASQGSLTLAGTGCKLPGNSNSTYKGYAFRLSVSNTTNAPITINIISITLDGQDLGASALVDLSNGNTDANPFVIPANTTITNAALLTANAPNSQNGALSITYTVNGGAPITIGATVPSAPPINGASCTAFSAAEKAVLAGVIGAVPAWQASTAYAAADTVQLTGGAFLSAVVGGTSGTTEPLPPGAGNQVVDNTVTWQQTS